jgi:hypothetical protein
MRKQTNDMGLENQWEAIKASLQEATSWLLLPLGKHIKPYFLFELFFKILNIRS